MSMAYREHGRRTAMYFLDGNPVGRDNDPVQGTCSLRKGGDHHVASQAARLRGGASPRDLGRVRRGRNPREWLGDIGAGPKVLLTIFGVLETSPETKEPSVAAFHPSSSAEEAREATGSNPNVDENVGMTVFSGEGSGSYAASRREPLQRERSR